MVRMALMAPKRAHEERNALRRLFTWYAPFQGLAVNVFIGAPCPSAEKTSLGLFPTDQKVYAFVKLT